MENWVGRAVAALNARRTRWRRARNIRAGRRLPAIPIPWAGLAASAAALAGALLLAGHARHLSAAVGPSNDAAETTTAVALDILQPVVPGVVIDVPREPGAHIVSHADAELVMVTGMHGAEPVRIDLCEQRGGAGELVPVRIGYSWETLRALAEKKLPMRNAVLSSANAGLPQLEISGKASGDAPLTVRWEPANARWVSDGPGPGLNNEGWLIASEGALRVQRRASRDCPSSGELLVQAFRKTDEPSPRAQVFGLPRHGRPVATSLPAGAHQVPLAARASLEDQAMFRQLHEHGLVRLGSSGLVEVAPRDLGAWQRAPERAHASALHGWPVLAENDDAARLFKRLYRMADGAYVREQVRIFNNERRLLAWRVRPGFAAARWQASVGGVPVPTAEQLPLAAARLFAQVPQGWSAWQRAAAWPGDAHGDAQLTVHLPERGGQRLDMLLVGRVLRVDGGRLAQAPRAACTGRACRSPDSVQQVSVDVARGRRSVTLTVAPLAMGALAGGAADQYRHLHVAGGQLGWRTLNATSAVARAAEPAGVVLRDRHGTLMWRAGSPTPAASRAGLAPLLGLRAEHTSSVAGMLARLPAFNGKPHEARLTLDLPMQQAAQQALDCIGMRRGQWDGVACSAGRAIPDGRRAGMVIIDTGSGDILAAAGSGGADVTAGNWDEVRDFDRANPDRSPLRLPALQHDGGVHRSPGSTFKIVTALGLELAAREDQQMASLLEGMALPALNRVASRKGFDFQTAAATYPVAPRQARITNYRDGHLDHRARDGRLGLSEALVHSLNTWFAWLGEMSDRTLLGQAEGGAPDLRALEPGALDGVRPVVAMAHRLGFERQLRLDGGLLPEGFRWQQWDALQPGRARIDPVRTRHELRQMAIGLRMQATPLHMAMVAGAIGEGRVIAPRLLLDLDGDEAQAASGAELGVRLDRIRAGMKGVVDDGTAAAAFKAPALAQVKRGLSGKTGTSPAIVTMDDGRQRELATVWFTAWLEPDTIPGEKRRLALAAFVSHSEGTGGEHAAPVVASVLAGMSGSRRQ
ncbi:hypothetical protein KY495_22315 [Massilia sp. PAMC28688]|uniref:penicillin-binding transpeptidase domain-containing protein n=1 Tax=Massilia sp. PAMC28688 TaxID=2861283 RepID=UPI001C625F24|nr:penicillin-binding transpeptidase domain-containing protein [Massilia sp. PAMC28688]QYF93371.1 hypothetical protein KY495_22315 [Massilia sp. PAMC28688]